MAVNPDGNASEKTPAPKKRTAVKIIRTVLIIIAIIPVLMVVRFLLFFCADTYNDTAQYGDFTVAYGYCTGYHKLLFQNHASVICFGAEGEDYDREIVIPDSYDGIEIRELGGFLGRGVPLPFYVEHSDNPVIDKLTEESENQYSSAFANLEERETVFDEVIYDDFVLKIGKQIENINSVCGVSVFELQDGSCTAYCTRFYVVCDEENPSFYSRDGVLYNKDGTVFSGFVYVGQELNTH